MTLCFKKKHFPKKKLTTTSNDVKERHKTQKMKIISGRQMKAPNNNQTN